MDRRKFLRNGSLTTVGGWQLAVGSLSLLNAELEDSPARSSPERIIVWKCGVLGNKLFQFKH